MPAAFRSVFRGRVDLLLENLVLRQQLAALVRGGRRPRVAAIDRWLWIAVRRRWSRWMDALVFVKPETVIRWHRACIAARWRAAPDGAGRLRRRAVGLRT